VLTAVLAVTALVAGLTGTWSPCGFSMIETIGSPRQRVLLACVTFGLGACVGGVATFVTLSAAGILLSGVVAIVVASMIALVAAGVEARGVPIAPQIRRQVPERWRRTLPLPLAAGLYGILLGLGFTTYVLTFAVWALAALVLAAGDPVTGAAVGLAFGIGRALPIVAIAPLVHRPSGVEALRTMAERPALLRSVRIVDAAALVLAVTTLVVGEARAANNLGPGWDPSASGDAVAWATSSGGVLVREGTRTALPGRPALGGSFVAWRTGTTHVQVAASADLTPVLDLSLAYVDAVAVSDRWLVTRERSPTGGDALVARPLQTPDQARIVASVTLPAQLGRPSLDVDTLVFHVATRRESRIVVANLAAGTSQVVRRSRAAQLTNPSILASDLLYVRQTSRAQFLELTTLLPRSRTRVLYRLGSPARRDPGYEPGHSRVTRTAKPRLAPGTLWTTALTTQQAYVTFVPRRDGFARASIVSVRR
jgi:cytochrome c biogenesis protein CcdA